MITKRFFYLALIIAVISLPILAIELDVKGLINKIKKQDFPAYPVKRSVESGLLQTWRGVVKTSEFENLPEQFKMPATFVKLAVKAVDSIPANDADWIRLNRLMGELKAHSLDPAMKDCFKVFIIEDENFDNAFTTGCHIFVTRSVPRMLKDNELRALLAHEMGHGFLGHFYLTYKTLAGKVGYNFIALPIEQVFWLFHGQFTGNIGHIHEIYLESFSEALYQFYRTNTYVPETFLDTLFQRFDALAAATSAGTRSLFDKSMQEFGASQETVELEADIAGALLLKRAGYSPEDLVKTLLKLERVSSEADLKPLPGTKENTIRVYPSLYYRIKAIRDAAKY